MGKSFKVKDLMINLSPQPLCLCGTQALTGTGPCLCVTHLGITCHPVTIQPCFCNSNAHISITACFCVSNHATLVTPCVCVSHHVFSQCPLDSRFNTCTPLASIPGGAGDLGDPAESLQSLEALRDQLKQSLAEVEKQHQAAQEALRPQTVAEVDELQKKLQDALEELKTRRAELDRKDKK
jgi:hypothetical protein